MPRREIAGQVFGDPFQMTETINVVCGEGI